jgi:hypothetical protein
MCHVKRVFSESVKMGVAQWHANIGNNYLIINELIHYQ